jgi:amino acid adenylation domain-containing protein
MDKQPVFPLREYKTLIDILQERIDRQPDQVLYNFLSDGETESGSLTYGELDQQARAIAVLLQKNISQPGERVLLLYPPGLEYISAFWGCLYAGMVAVPSYPPRLNRPDPRLQTIAQDARARVALTTPPILSSIEQRLANTPDLASIRWLTTQDLDVTQAEQWQAPQSTSDSLAFLQYTSGSTAQPKGVMVSHGNLVHNLEKIHQFFGMNPQSRGVIWLPPYHDMGLIGGLLESLYAGITTVIMPPTAFLQKPARWLQALSRYRGTVSGGPNFAYEFCSQKMTEEQKAGLDLSTWQVAFTGAEPIQKATLERFAKTFEPYGFRREAFYACYGLAEATLIATGGAQSTWPTIRTFAGDELTRNIAVPAGPEEPNPRELVSSGASAPDQKLLIVDPQTFQPCPDTQVGEIWMAGPSIARGYWNRPDDTAQIFDAHLKDGGEGPFMRTGDLGFIHAGEVFIAGRAKDLIIIRGRNHYPQDIELTVEGSHPAVGPSSGAAFSVEIQGEEKLVIVQEVDRHAKAEEYPGIIAAIRQAVVEEHELQAYAVVLIRVGSIPRTSSFKIQRRACRAQYLDGSLTILADSTLETETIPDQPESQPDLIRDALADANDPADRRTLLTAYLQEQAARILHVPAAQIDPQQPLNTFGLDSMMAVELKYAIETALQVSLPMEDFLQGISIGELVTRILEMKPGGQTAITPAAEIPSDAPLSHGQRALWFLHQLAPDSAAYHISNAARIRTRLDVPALKRAFQDLSERHPALRTIFPTRGEEPVQRVLDRMEIPVETRDVSAWNRAQIDEFLAHHTQHPFDLEHGPLLRVVLLSLAVDKYILLVVAHHIIADFWSLAILADELGQRYTAESGGAAFIPAPLALRYSDYVRWQSGVLAGAEGARSLAYWQKKLKGELPVLDLPTDHPRPPAQTYRGGSQSLRIDSELSRKIKDFNQQRGTTLYMTLLAAFQVLLYRYTGQTDILVGSPTAGRGRAEFSQLVGYFVNPITLRADLSNNPAFEAFLAQVRQTALEAFAHQDYPFGLLVEHIQPRRDPSRSPIFQVMFSLQKTPLLDSPELASFALGEASAALDLHGLPLESMSLQQLSSQFDLTLAAAETAEGLGFSIHYNRDLFDENTIRRMLEQLQTLLDGIVADPKQSVASLPMLPAFQRQIIADWNDRASTPLASEGGACIHELFEAQVERSSDAVALVFEKQEITYRELNARANQLAHHLRSLGVQPGTLVGLCVERSTDMLVGLLGILKAGGAYIPLDPMYPNERLAYMLENSQAGILLTQAHLVDELPGSVAQKICLDRDWPAIAAHPETNLAGHFSNDNLAYLIYTSGSTGTPKGVQLQHRSVVNFLHSMRHEPGLNEKDVLVSVTTLAFDIAALELFLPLTVGARLVLASREVTLDGRMLAALMSASGATCVQATPATWRLLLETGWAGDAQLKILCGGEALPRDLANKLIERCDELWNMYGPTETTIWSTTCRVERGEGPISIGHPIANTQIYILDASGSLAPIGVPGELMIGGDGLARGYFGRPDLTSEKFIPDPFAVTADNHRLYRTGDLARFRLDKDGQVFIEFLGRLDYQVKIRGFRIELSEIETLLSQHPALKTSVVMAQEWGAHGENHLIAYIVPAGESAPAASELRGFLKTRLPDYMLPSVFVSLDALPLTPNGKVNRKALRIPEDETVPETVFTAPHSDLEQKIAQIWKDVLHLKSVGIHDNFFDLGGHSLMMARVHHRLHETLGREISMVELFQYPTIDALAKYLSGAAAARPARSQRKRAQEETGIAVVAMAGRFPGADNLEAFWQNLSGGVESIRPLSDDELTAAGVDPALLADPNYVRVGSTLEGVESFDATFFGYSPSEAEILDPQQRVFLECAWEALERAGYDSDRYDGRIGVYASAGLNGYLLNNLRSNRPQMQTADGYQIFIANDKDFTPTRVSYKLNLRGPSVNVQSACSSSLVAIHLASQSLLNGECDMALAGGVSINLPQKAGYLYQERGIASRDGHCRAFDAKAGGTVRGDGVGIVVLKRLSDAIAQRDTICAVIRGSAINNDGSLKVGYTAPSVQGQAEAISEALEISGVDPETIGYIEAHGTGTEIGDPIEVAALTQAFGALTDKKNFCAIGSLKTNIGHLDTAAGAAGFIKTVLSLQHGQIPPSLHFEKPNPRIDFAESPFFVNTQLAEWKKGGTPLRAGVSSFGVGGTNAHAVLEAAPAPGLVSASRDWQLLLLSAKTETALATATSNLASYLKQVDPNPSMNSPVPAVHRPAFGAGLAQAGQALADAAYTLQVGRRTFNYRRALVCRDNAEAVDALESLDPRKVLSGAQELKERPVAFMFTGQGAQYVNMGAELYRTEPVFRAEVDRCAEILLQHLDVDLRQVIYPAPDANLDEAAKQLNQTQFTQPALFVIEYAMARLWMAWGLSPNAMIGHSIGEYVAACLAGVFSLEDALALVATRGRLMQSLPGGNMLAVPLTEKEVLPYLGSDLSLAAVNAPNMCVVSGAGPAVEELERRLTAKNIAASRLRTSHAFHSAMMDPILDEFKACVASATRNAPQIPCISNLTGDWLTAEQAVDPVYWADHLRRAVRFAQGVEKLLGDAAQILLEVGPGRTLNTLATRHPAKQPENVILSSLRHPQDQQPDSAFLLTTLGKLWLAGTKINWDGFYAAEQRQRLPLPTYPFERQRYWIEVDTSAQPARYSDKKKADMADWFYAPSWKRSALVRPTPEATPARWLLLADETGLAAALAARLEQAGHEVFTAQVGLSFAKIEERAYTVNPGEPGDYDALLDDLRQAGKLPQTIVHLWNVTSAPETNLDAALDRSFYSLLFLAQSLGKRNLTEEIRILALSNHLHDVSGDELIVPEKAALLGPIQIVPLEYPQLRCRAIDLVLPESGISPKLVEMLFAEVCATTTDPIVAWRGQHRWVQSFEPLRLEEPKETISQLRQDGVYLVTGGLGGIGLTLAKHLAESVHAKLALVDRPVLPPVEEWASWLSAHDENDTVSRKIRRVQEIEQAGGQALVVAADVTETEQMHRVVAQVQAQFGPINGVIHAAGLPGGGVIQLKTRAAAENVMAAKVRGTLALAEAVKNQPLDFIVLCSSINAVVGRLGQVDYVAANAFMDAFVHAHPELPFVDINWETWRETGMAAAAMQQWAGAGSGTINHPLFEQRQAVSADADVYISHLRASDHWEMNEHWILNKPTLPGTAYIEMARVAFEAHTGQSVMDFHNIVFLKPLVLEGDEEKEVRLLLKKQGIGFAFSVMSKISADVDEWEEHANGSIFPLENAELVKQDLAEIESRCNERDVPAPLEQPHLGHFRLERGSLPAGQSILITDETDAEPRSMEFGLRWTTLRSVKLGAEEGLGLFQLPEAFAADLDVYKLHPALLDFAASFLRLFKSEGSYLPLSYKRLKLNGPLPLKLYSHARFVGGHETGSQTLRFDLSLLDENGLELVTVEEFSVIHIGDAGKLSATRHSTTPDQFFHAQREASLQTSGLNKDLAEGLTSAEGVQVFDRILSSGLARVVVSTRDLAARIEYNRAQSAALVTGNAEQAESRPCHPRPQLMTLYAAPRNETEQKLAEIWQSVLGIEGIGVHDNFFDLGGDSLLITRVHTRFVEVFERDMSVANLMQYPTIADLAQQIAQSDKKAEEPSFETVRERTSKQKEAMQLRKQKLLNRRQR